MKNQLLLIFLFSVILCSQTFLRKLEDAVTEESCKKQGKKYQEAGAAECKLGEVVIDAKEEKDCVKGTWEAKTPSCSASELKTENECKGTPVFTAGTDKVKKCKLGDEEITDSTLLTKEACQKELVWTDEKCTITATEKTQAECTALKGQWTKTESASTRRTADDASGATTPTTTTDEKGSCVYSEKKSEADCTKASGQYTKGSCSVSQFDSSEKCQGTPVYSEETKGECKSGNTVLTSRVTEKECKVDLVWVTGTCSYEKILTKEECETKPSYTAATPAKCIGDSSSNSNFIKAINFALLAICLLIL